MQFNNDENIILLSGLIYFLPQNKGRVLLYQMKRVKKEKHLNDWNVFMGPYGSYCNNVQEKYVQLSLQRLKQK